MSATRILNLVWFPVTILVAWEIGVAVGLLDPLIFPAPTTVVATAVAMVESGELTRELGITLTRMLSAEPDSI